MDIKNLVHVEGKIVTITTLDVGDVYVRLDVESGYNESRLRYGVVSNILANGEEVVIIAVERGKARYSNTLEVVTKVFKTGEDLQLFAADMTSFAVELESMTEAVSQQRKAAEAELARVSELELAIEDLHGLRHSIERDNPSTHHLTVQ